MKEILYQVEITPMVKHVNAGVLVEENDGIGMEETGGFKEFFEAVLFAENHRVCEGKPVLKRDRYIGEAYYYDYRVTSYYEDEDGWKVPCDLNGNEVEWEDALHYSNDSLKAYGNVNIAFYEAYASYVAFLDYENDAAYTIFDYITVR